MGSESRALDGSDRSAGTSRRWHLAPAAMPSGQGQSVRVVAIGAVVEVVVDVVVEVLGDAVVVGSTRVVGRARTIRCGAAGRVAVGVAIATCAGHQHQTAAHRARSHAHA